MSLVTTLEEIRDAITGTPAPRTGSASLVGTLNQIRDAIQVVGGRLIASFDPYDEMMNRLQLCKPVFDEWKVKFSDHANTLSRDIANAFNQYRTVGHFEAPEVMAREIFEAFTASKPFDPDILRMFTGRAVGDLRIYRPDVANPGNPPVEIPAPTAYTVWAEVTEHEGGLFRQRTSWQNQDPVTGEGRHIRPSALGEVMRELSRERLDLIFNAYTPDLGLVSWSSFYQNHANQMRSIGYNLGGKRLLWINQFLNPDFTVLEGPLNIPLPGDPVVILRDQLILSIDHERTLADGSRHFQVYAMHINFDFDQGTAEFAGPIQKMDNTVV
jgi:hypothetical protein